MNTSPADFAEKLQSMDCRRDVLARRVLNTAPDTDAGITAAEIEEGGITLERLEALPVPVYRYSTQITIHGRIPDFQDTRIGGYRAAFKNGNGSLGVRYSAIDAGKKDVIARCARVCKGWNVSRNSSEFSVWRAFYVLKEEEREGQRAAAIACLKGLPVGRFFGSAGAGCLAYGLGYYVSMQIGAIPVAELWPFIGEIFGMTEADLTAREAEEQARRDAQNAKWEEERKERQAAEAIELAARRERFAAFMLTITAPRLRTIARGPGVFYRYSIKREEGGTFPPCKVEIKKRGACLCYLADAMPGDYDRPKWRKVEARHWKFWDEAAAAGLIVRDPSAQEGDAAKDTVTKDAKDVPASAAKAISNPEEPASSRQTFALFCATGKDFRTRGLTRGQASAALEAASPYRGDKAAGLAAVEKALASGASGAASVAASVPAGELAAA